MTYTLHHLAPGSYDLALDGIVMGGVVRETTARGTPTGWCVELLEDQPAATRPHPFDCVEHRFPTLEAATAWLSWALIADDPLPRASTNDARSYASATRRS